MNDYAIGTDERFDAWLACEFGGLDNARREPRSKVNALHAAYVSGRTFAQAA